MRFLTPGQLLSLAFPRSQRRRALLYGLLGAALALMGFSGPWSPLAGGRIQRLIDLGDMSAAITVSEQVIAYNPIPSVRHSARFQAAVLQTTVMGQHEEALEPLRWLSSRLPTSDPMQLRSAELLASTLAYQGRPKRAAWRYQKLAIQHPEAPQAASWLLAAAQQRELAGHPRRALLLRAQVAVSGGPAAPGAWLEMGRMQLQREDPARAYECYRRAQLSAASDAVLRLSRIGKAIALEQLGKVDAAVAELDAGLDTAGADGDEALSITREHILNRAGYLR